MTTDIFEYPREWYSFTTVRFQLRSMSQVSSRPWSGGNSVYGPHAQLWMPKLTAATQDAEVWQPMDAFFSRLGGQAGLIRIGDPSRLVCQFNRENTASQEQWSDSTFFTDGTGFVSGLIPPTAFITTAVDRGENAIIIGGLPVSTSRALRRGDLLELRQNGIATACPNLYQVMVDGSTNSAGETGVEIRPRLRQAMAAGDMVVIDHPTSTFHLVDDSQAEMEITPPLFAAFGFSLVEAIENAI